MQLNLNRQITKSYSILGLIQILSTLLGFFTVPLFIKYLDKHDYGIWLTLFSTINWINILDIGIGNGLRNKLSESLSENNIILSRSYIGSSIIFFLLFFVITYIPFRIISAFFDYRILFNIADYSQSYFFKVINIALLTVLIEFIYKLFDSISYATHVSYLPKLKLFVKNLIILTLLYLLANGNQTNNKLLNLTYIYLITTVIVNVVFSLIIIKKNQKLFPSINEISFKYIKTIGGMGIKFFIIQISSLIIFSTDNFIILHLLSPDDVTSYNIIQKMFMVVILGQTLLTIPLWSAYTLKYTNKDYGWIRSTLKKSLLYSLFLGLIAILILVFSKYILILWLGNTNFYNLALIIAFLIYTFIRLWNSNFSTLLNGIGSFKIQMYTTVIGAIINIPLSILFVKYYNWGLPGVITASSISLLLFSILAPLNTKKHFVIKQL